MPHIRAGRLRPLGVTTLKRLSILPDVPPIGDTVRGFEVVHWYAMWAPKGTPQAIVELWNAEVARVLNSAQMQRQMANEGLEGAGGPPQEFYEVNKKAIQNWRRVIKEAKLGSAN
jgi:tripartite-type tricarboxylate transporter receptor subunit TctC